MLRRALCGLAAMSVLSSCVGGVAPPPRPGGGGPYRGGEVPPRQPVAATPLPPVPAVTAPGATNARAAGVVRGPAVATLPITRDGAAQALAAFRLSCRELIRRTDTTGLTTGADWQPACAAAATATAGDAPAFFARWFETAQIGDGRASATGYYIPEIAGSFAYRDGYAPIYARPTDLVDVDLGQFSADLKGRKIRGRVDATNLVPYYDRAAIEQGALNGKARVLGYAVDPIEFFFLQVQGSGLVRMPDGQVLRIGYDSQNGRDYTGIGALMRQRGLLGPNQLSMQGVVAWLRANPEQGRAIMRENKSFVFFRLLDGPPIGAMGLAVTGGTTVAADPAFVPLGAPLFLSMDRTDATGLWVAQDTGGAIRGANRFDTFWGAGSEARAIAGGMSARGTAFLLLPIGTLDRLQGAAADGRTTPRR